MALSKTFDDQKSTAQPKPIVAVGSLTLDNISQVDKRPTDAKVPGHNKKRPGGGGFNFFNALIGVSKVYNAPVAPTLVTKFGEATLSDGTLDSDIDRLVDISNHKLAEKLLNLFGISIVDAMKNRPHKIPENSVIEHSKGRDIYTSFSEAVGKFSSEFKRDLENTVKNASLVFVHTRYPFQSHMAVQAAKKHGVPVFMDYSVTEPPSDDLRAETYEYLLSNADYIVAPAEAVTPEMPGSFSEDDPQKAQKLIGNILKYGGKNVAVSNNSDPVQVYSETSKNKYSSVKIISVTRPYLNGIGDTRNGATALALYSGASFVQAIRAGSAIASLKATTPGLKFLETMQPEDAPEMNNALHPSKEQTINLDMDDI